MIDLHAHTTASDGRSAPHALVDEAIAAGCVVLAVTDHDTVAGIASARQAAAAAGLRLVDGIEMSAVADGVDLHILGYFIDVDDESLGAFLRRQREQRIDRVRAIGDRLARAGVPVDTEAIVAAAIGSGRAVGRPAIAQALIAAGHAVDVPDAFARYLSIGRPGYAPRAGAPPADVIARIRAAGGIASIAHPGKTRRDELIPSLVDAGLGAIEAYHTDHTVADVVRYQTMADRLGVVVSGGSDYHGPGSGRTQGLGLVGLPPAAFERLVERADHLRRQ